MKDHLHKIRFDRLDRLSDQLDAAFGIPGTRFRVDHDAIAGTRPVIGDAAAAMQAAWIMIGSSRMGLPPAKMASQGLILAVDSIIGSIPVLGTILDAGDRSNLCIVEILRTHPEGGWA